MVDWERGRAWTIWAFWRTNELVANECLSCFFEGATYRGVWAHG